MSGRKLYLNVSNNNKNKTPWGNPNLTPSRFVFFLLYSVKINEYSTNINNEHINMSISCPEWQSTVTNHFNDCLKEWLTDVIFIMTWLIHWMVTNGRWVNVLQSSQCYTVATYMHIHQLHFIWHGQITSCVFYANNYPNPVR